MDRALQTAPLAFGLTEARRALAGRAVLVVEDEFLVALAIEDVLADLGCRVIGPAGSVSEGLRLVAEAAFDAALLDVNLGRGETSLPIAAALAEAGAAFLFVTGYGAAGVPERFRDRPVVSKPLAAQALSTALLAVLAAAPPVVAAGACALLERDGPVS